MTVRAAPLFLLFVVAACGNHDSPDLATRLAHESIRVIENAIPGVKWARSGGGGGSKVSQRDYELTTLEAVPAENVSGLMDTLHERVLAVLKDLKADIHGRGKSGGLSGLHAFRLRFDVGRASGTYSAWLVRLDQGKYAVFVSATGYQP
jgi:hypothetical protein